jgi:hypothetical protein
MNLENYIINDKSLVENSKIKTPIYMKNFQYVKIKEKLNLNALKQEGISNIPMPIYIYLNIKIQKPTHILINILIF